MRKKLSWITLVVILLSVLLSACGGGAAPTEQPQEPQQTEAPEPQQPEVSEALEPAQEIVIFNWSEYIDPEIYTLFTEEFGIQVVEDNFSNNEELLAKLQGGATGYTLIVPSDYTVGIMIEEGMLAPLDHANIPNLENLAPRFRELPFDQGNQYCAAYQWGTTGIGYLASQVDEPTSWAAIF